MPLVNADVKVRKNNRMKWTATQEQLLTFAKGVLALEGGLSLATR